MAKRMTERDVVEAAEAAGLEVHTRPWGRGRTLYIFFRRGEAPQGAFSSGRLGDAEGASAAVAFVARRRELDAYAAAGHAGPVTPPRRKKLTMADVRAGSAEWARRRGQSFHFFDPKTSKAFGPNSYSGPYQGEGGVYFVATTRVGSRVYRFHPEDGDIQPIIHDPEGAVAARELAKHLARGYAPAKANARRRAPHDHGFVKGARVQTHPATDAWMRGDRYGDVVSATATRVRVKLDRSGRTFAFAPKNLLPVD